MIELGGGYAEGGEDLYVEQLEAKRRKDHGSRYRQPSHLDHRPTQHHHVQHHQTINHHQDQHHHAESYNQLQEAYKQQQESYKQQQESYKQQQYQASHQRHHEQQRHHYEPQKVAEQPEKSQDHLASFVDVDFEHFVPGQVEDIEPPRRKKHPNLAKHPSNFSVLVSGLSKNPDAKELAKLFKQGAVEEQKHKAFITKNHVAPPKGYGKVTLPFLDPSEAAEKRVDTLPSVFIAPVGYKVPAGYKGHPLPYDPSVIDRLTTEEVNLVHSTEETPSFNDIDDVRNPFLPIKRPVLSEPEQEVLPVVNEEPVEEVFEEPEEAIEEDEVSSPTALVLNKIKLARSRSRAHLASLYKNQENQGPTGAIAPITSIITDLSGRKRKKILTKIVRKPYNPDTTTTPATQKVSEDDVHTVVRIVDPNVEKKDPEVHEEVTESTFTVTTTTPLEDEQITVKTEEDIEVVTTTAANTPEPYTTGYFEPTTTTEYENEAEPSIDHLVFVTSPRPTLQPANFITRRQPVISTTTLPPQTETTTTVQETHGYQPTPFSPLDPFKRLRFKATRKPFISYTAVDTTVSNTPVTTEEETTTTSTTTTKKPYEIFSPLLKLRKYGFNQGENNGRIYGQRIKARRRPSYWANREETYEYYPPTTETSTTTKKPVKEDKIKNRFRPFFDQLYEQLTGSTTTLAPVTESSKRILPYWARPRSTTTSNPYTINAEIYEVYPKHSTASESEEEYYDEYYEHDYEAKPKLDNVEEIEYIEEATTEHETADKHSTTEHILDTTDYPKLKEIFVEEPQSNFVDSDVRLDFGESQNQATAWNEVVPAPARGLDSYSKDFTPSQQIANDHDKDYKQPKGIYNEHSQQQLSVGEEDFIPFQSTERPKLPYVEIQRDIAEVSAPIQISIEKVPTNDNDFLKNILDQVYDKIPAEPIVNEVEYEEIEEQDIEETTPFVFITPPAPATTYRSVEAQETETDHPGTTVYQETDEPEDVLSTVETFYQETTQKPQEIDFETTTFDEPEPTAEVGQESVDENLIENEVTQTTASDLEVTTFRPKGGFLNSLSNFINQFLPATTSTTVDLPTTTIFTTEEFTTTVSTTTTTTTTTEKALEVDVGIVDAEVTKTVPSPTPEERLEDPTPTRPELVETTVPETTESSTTEVEVTTFRYPLRLHRPKKYPPTARDDQLHLEFLKSKTTTVEEVPTTTEEIQLEENDNVSKDVFGAIRREEYFKNWVARKYRKPEDGKSKFTLNEFPVTTSQQTTTLPTTISTTQKTEVETEAVTESNVLLPFAPTVLPKFDDYARRQKKISFLEKLKNSARNSLFKKPSESESENVEKSIPTTTTTTTRRPVLYPRGSKLNLFKTWGSSKLSQAEFEKTVLGVSTATEVTVQSRICVRGHCYNADDQAAASSFYKNSFR